VRFSGDTFLYMVWFVLASISDDLTWAHYDIQGL